MLEEAVGVMRALWTGEVTSLQGTHYRVDRARVYTLPEEPIEVVVAAGEHDAAELAGRIGDGPHYGQLTVCWAEEEDDAKSTAFEIWPNAALKGPLSQELALPGHFEEPSAMVTESEVAEMIVCGPDPARHLEGIQMFVDAGFDHVYVHQVGPDQEGFLEFYEREILAAARELRPARERQNAHA